MATTAAQRRNNSERQARWRAKKKLEAQQQTLSQGGLSVESGVVQPGETVIAPDAVVETGLKVKVNADTTPKAKPTLRERLGLGSSKPVVAPAKKTSTSKNKPNLIVTLLPSLLAALIAAYARDRIPEEYKPCAPSPEEVKGVLSPLMDIVGRRVEIAAQVSQDAIDLTNALVCIMAYGVRAYVTFVDIKKAKEAGLTYEQKQQIRQQQYREQLERESREYDAVINEPEQTVTLAGGMRAYQSQNNGTAINSVGTNGGRPYESGYGTASDGAGDSVDDKELRDREVALITDMFARDRAGRVRLGLLPV